MIQFLWMRRILLFHVRVWNMRLVRCNSIFPWNQKCPAMCLVFSSRKLHLIVEIRCDFALKNIAVAFQTGDPPGVNPGFLVVLAHLIGSSWSTLSIPSWEAFLKWVQLFPKKSTFFCRHFFLLKSGLAKLQTAPWMVKLHFTKTFSSALG